LSGAVKSKSLNRNGVINSEESSERHSAVPRLPIPSTISKDTMVSKLINTLIFYTVQLFSSRFSSLMYLNSNFILILDSECSEGCIGSDMICVFLLL